MAAVRRNRIRGTDDGVAGEMPTVSGCSGAVGWIHGGRSRLQRRPGRSDPAARVSASFPAARASMRRGTGQRVPHRLRHVLAGLLSPGPPLSSPSHAPGRTHSGLSANDSIGDDPLANSSRSERCATAIPYARCNAIHQGYIGKVVTTSASHGAYSIETSRENPLAERWRGSARPHRGGIRADKRAMR